MTRTIALHDELCASRTCTPEMHRAAVEYREALEHMRRSIEKASDDKERETLVWLLEQWDEQGVQRLTREMQAKQGATCAK